MIVAPSMGLDFQAIPVEPTSTQTNGENVGAIIVDVD